MDLRENEIFPDQIPPNDDLDLQLLWLQVLERKGIHLTSRDLAEAWQQYCWYPFNEYGYFLHNFERKIDPPVSGWYNNQFFRQSMGSPIRSEIWGMIAVGNPGLAMRYAYLDATLDHDTESVWGEQMLAAIEAEAFFEPDVDRLLDFGLAQIPPESSLHQCIEFVRGEYCSRDAVAGSACPPVDALWRPRRVEGGAEPRFHRPGAAVWGARLWPHAADRPQLRL